MASTNRLTNTFLQTSSAVIKATPGVVVTATLVGGSAASSLTLYNAVTAAAGTEILKLTCVATDSKVATHEVVANTGIYAAIAGTGAAYIIQYD